MLFRSWWEELLEGRAGGRARRRVDGADDGPVSPPGGGVRIEEPRVEVVVGLVGQERVGLVAAALLGGVDDLVLAGRSEEHTSELQSLLRLSYAVFCLKQQITL